MEISFLLSLDCHFKSLEGRGENMCGQSSTLNQNASFLGTRVRSPELGELQSVLVLTERQSWASEPHIGSVSYRRLTGQLPSALLNWNAHHAFCQCQVYILSKLPFKIFYSQWLNFLCFDEGGITLLFSRERKKCR